jgi:hypothetical protein
MALLEDEVQNEVKERFKELIGPVRLVNFAQKLECHHCEDTRRLTEEIASLSEKITSEIYNFALDKERVQQYKIDKIPAIMEQKAREINLQIKRTPLGFTPIPLKSDGSPLREEEFQKLNTNERRRIEENMKSIQKNIKETFEQFNLLERKSKEELTKFNKDIALSLVGYRIDILKANYKDYLEVLHHLDEVKADL